jgi:hypothetical protein
MLDSRTPGTCTKDRQHCEGRVEGRTSDGIVRLVRLQNCEQLKPKE